MGSKKRLLMCGELWDVLCKGWFHHPNTHWLMVHLWQDDAGRKGGDQPAGGNRSGSAQDNLGAPFSLSALSKSALTHHRQAGGVVPPAAAVRSPGAAPPGCPPLPVYTSRRQRRLVHRTQLRRSPGAWGPSATNKLRRVYTGALLATTTSAYK